MFFLFQKNQGILGPPRIQTNFGGLFKGYSSYVADGLFQLLLIYKDPTKKSTRRRFWLGVGFYWLVQGGLDQRHRLEVLVYG